MLARVLCVVLLAVLVSAPARAQTPSPTPSPAPRGSREATERAIAAYDKALAAYEAASSDPHTDLKTLGTAYYAAVDAGHAADQAVEDETTKAPEVLAAGKKWVDAQEKVKTLQHDKQAPVGALTVAKIGEQQNKEKFDRVFDQTKHKILVETHKARDFEPPQTSRHAQMIREMQEAFQKEQQEKAKKAKADKDKPEKDKQSRNASPVRPTCAPATTLAGAMNNLACKEQHGG